MSNKKEACLLKRVSFLLFGICKPRFAVCFVWVKEITPL